MSITLESPKNVSAETLLTDIYALDNNQLQNEIRHLATMTAAAMCRLLLLVSELDRREDWGDWGVRSCAHWLSWQCGFSLGTSREHVRVACALPGLQLIVGIFATGEISYAKVRAITRVAKPEIEWRTEGGGVHTLTIRMTSEERAIIQRSHGEFMKYVSAETLSDDKDGECNVDNHDIPPKTARRLSCDAPVVVSLLDKDGVVLKMGRKTRLFTGASHQALVKRGSDQSREWRRTLLVPSPISARRWI